MPTTPPPPRMGAPDASVAPDGATVVVIDGIDADAALHLLQGNVDRLARVLQVFAQHHAADVAALRAAAAGGDDPRRCLHGLKGSAAAVGAREVQQLAAMLDDRLRQGALPATLAPELSRLADTLERLLGQIRARLPD